MQEATLCASAAIADLWPDGTLDVQTRNAPPAIHLRPDRTAELLAGTGPRLQRLGHADLLVLCSAAFLEEPPPILATLRRTTHSSQRLLGLRRRLTGRPAHGALATTRLIPAAAHVGEEAPARPQIQPDAGQGPPPAALLRRG